MERFSTLAALDMQHQYVSSVYDKIYFSIFGKVTPLRKTELKGIQLTENVYPKNGKKKTVNEVDAPEPLLTSDEEATQEEETNENQLNQ